VFNWIAIAVWLLAISMIVGSEFYAGGATPVVPACVSDEDRVHIRAQVLSAVDEAFRDNVKHLFAGWLKDPHQQPERASAGLQSSVVAYQRARADALKWSPTSC
jgi:hypothetical protein